jgi:predicted RNA-binding Zn-ribbon protein involved in translation (DUF1610 family)
VRQSKYTKELLAPLATSARSLAEVLKKLQLRPTGGNYRMLALRLRLCGIETEHFKGAGWARGLSEGGDQGVANNVAKRRRPDSEVFVSNSPELSGARLVRRLIRLGWAYRCHECGISAWRDLPISFHLDHINGINNDNRLENLRFLCPNCHSQTATYCKKMSARATR